MAYMLRNEQPVSPSWSMRSGPLCLAIVGLLSLARLRFACEEPLGMALEAAVQGGLLAWVVLKRSWLPSRANTSQTGVDARTVLVLLSLAVLPWLLAVLLRLLGRGTGFELIMLSSFGWTTLGAALLLQHRRALSTTVICSGFLTLFTTCSSDQAVALVFAYVWGALCLWFLASNHWRRLSNCQASTVTESRISRPLTVLLGSLIFLTAAWSVAGRFPDARKPGVELMPTSGGTTISDSQANGGVGDGDAVVAAREHAASFGAVETDVFLDSEEPSLFDLFSDTFGEPVRKKNTERAIALAPQETETTQPETMSQSDQSSSKLTTQRRGNHKPTPPKPSISTALLFWIGRADMHLPIRRYAHFDGRDWSQSVPGSGQALSSSVDLSKSTFATSAKALTITQETIGDRAWFTWVMAKELQNGNNNPFMGAEAEALKFARLRSNAIPAPSGMTKWHIDKVDDPTMFSIDHDSNLIMPGRQRVPEYTIVRYVNRMLDIERVQKVAATSTAREPFELTDQGNAGRQQAVMQLLRTWLGERKQWTRWEQVEAIVRHLREDFTFDRQQDYSQIDDPVAEFLKRQAGNDLMFATTAAVLLKQLGMESRLATGFVAREEHRLGFSNEIAIYPDDMHAWLEVCLAPGCWIPIEPTPGYPQPQMHVSWGYWLKANAWLIAGWLLALSATLSIGWRLRAGLFDLCSYACGGLIGVLPDRQRCRAVLMLLDTRSRLVGKPRPIHVSPRAWYGPLVSQSSDEVQAALQQLWTESDRLWFGRGKELSDRGRDACCVLWRKFTCKRLQKSL